MDIPETAAQGFLLMGGKGGFLREICDMIGDTMLFADLPWHEIETLAHYVQCYQVNAGTEIFKEGDPGSFMGILVKGHIQIFKEDHEGTQKRLFCVSHGKTIGEMSIIDHEPRSATCIAKEDSVMLVLSRRCYDGLIKERPALAVHILTRISKLMSQRLRGVNGQLVEYLEQEE